MYKATSCNGSPTDGRGPDTRSTEDFLAHIQASTVKEDSLRGAEKTAAPESPVTTGDVPVEARSWMQFAYTSDSGVTTKLAETDHQRGWDNPIRTHVLHGHVASSTFVAPSAPRHTIRRHTPTSRAPRRRTHRGRARARAPDPDLDSDPPGDPDVEAVGADHA
jgi:hypothetical protein